MKTVKLAGLALTLPLLLVACPGPTPPPVVTSNKVSGTLFSLADTAPQLVAWQGGVGTIKAFGGGPDRAGSSNAVSLGEGAVAADGSFTLELADVPAEILMPSNGDGLNMVVGQTECTGNVQVSNQAARIAPIGFEVSGSTENGVVLPTKIEPPRIEDSRVSVNAKTGVFIYSDSATTITGEQVCPSLDLGGNFTVKTNIKLVKGYNKLTIDYTLSILSVAGVVSGSDTVLSLTNGEFPAQWASASALEAALSQAIGPLLPSALHTPVN
ncbi:hypothetical protein [Deinococcus sp.]|uniref:hypothetical protein n=1 Tax=Deinococcus sp. TaxID=47478 RepID=UPI003B5A76F6